MSDSRLTISPARRLALSVLLAVAEKRARPEEALGARLGKVSLEDRDRALAHEIIYGSLRWQGLLDYYLAHFSKRPLEKLSPDVLALLRIGAYQIIKLDRVPDRAAVDTTVELARSRLPKWTAGYINGVLRTLARRHRTEPPLPDAGEDPIGHLAVSLSHPAWLAGRWLEELGFEECRALLEANNRPPVLTLRAGVAPGDREALMANLARSGFEVRPGGYSPQALLVPGGRLAGLEEAAGEELAAQSEASQLVGLVVAPKPGWSVLDLCAGAGGKTSHLADLMAGQGRIVALDRDRGRVEAGQALVRRLGFRNVEYFAADALKKLLEEADGKFDAVLVDAPCSGLGSLRSRPDGRWRVGPDDPARLSQIQGRLLDVAAGRVRPGGRLVYATCTLLREENEDVAAGFLASHPDFAIDDPRPDLPGLAKDLVNEKGFVATWPHRHQSAGHPLDGFFIARFVRRS